MIMIFLPVRHIIIIISLLFHLRNLFPSHTHKRKEEKSQNQVAAAKSQRLKLAPTRHIQYMQIQEIQIYTNVQKCKFTKINALTYILIDFFSMISRLLWLSYCSVCCSLTMKYLSSIMQFVFHM